MDGHCSEPSLSAYVMVLFSCDEALNYKRTRISYANSKDLIRVRICTDWTDMILQVRSLFWAYIQMHARMST